MQTNNTGPRLPLNGTQPPRNRRVRVKTPSAAEGASPDQAKTRLTVPVLRFRSTIALGIFMPILSLALSWGGGVLLSQPEGADMALGIAALVLMACVLGVSLEHLAWAIGDLSKSAWWQSWALAVAMDCTIVWCKLVHVLTTKAGMGWLTWPLMLVVVGASAWFNCWAFIMAPKAEKRAAAREQEQD